MKFWTIQNKHIKDIIESEGVYQPDFKFSTYPQMDEKWASVYNYVLLSFNENNISNYPGLIFAFAKSEDNYNVNEFDNIKDFQKFLFQKRIAIDGIIKKFDQRNDAIFELEYQDYFNPIFIDIDDFQEIKDPHFNVFYKTNDDILKIYGAIKAGKFRPSKLPSGIIQAHLPNIKRNNIIGEYDVNLIKFTT